MPSNRFPDSSEKRALRRRDAQLLEQFVKRIGHQLDYCGMPSVEFLDVEAWKTNLRSVLAVEYDSDVANDMRIERDGRQFPFVIKIVQGEICRFLLDSADAFDVYNLDFYTGFVNPDRQANARSVSAIRRTFARQSQSRRSFALVTTFNVRDKGANEYLKFLEAARRELSSRPNADENISAHAGTQASRLKICFPFFCWQQAHATGFEQETEGVYVYHSAVAGSDERGRPARHTMVHFHQRFMFRKEDILAVPVLQALIDVANLTLYEMREQVPHKRLVPPQITN